MLVTVIPLLQWNLLNRMMDDVDVSILNNSFYHLGFRSNTEGKTPNKHFVKKVAVCPSLMNSSWRKALRGRCSGLVVTRTSVCLDTVSASVSCVSGTMKAAQIPWSAFEPAQRGRRKRKRQRGHSSCLLGRFSGNCQVTLLFPSHQVELDLLLVPSS